MNTQPAEGAKVYGMPGMDQYWHGYWAGHARGWKEGGSRAWSEGFRVGLFVAGVLSLSIFIAHQWPV